MLAEGLGGDECERGAQWELRVVNLITWDCCRPPRRLTLSSISPIISWPWPPTQTLSLNQSCRERKSENVCVCVYLTYFCLVFGAPPNSNEVLGFFKLKYHFILAPVILPSACFYLDCLSVLLKGERPHFTLQCLHVIDNTFKTKENYYFLNAETTYMLNLSWWIYSLVK